VAGLLRACLEQGSYRQCEFVVRIARRAGTLWSPGVLRLALDLYARTSPAKGAELLRRWAARPRAQREAEAAVAAGRDPPAANYAAIMRSFLSCAGNTKCGGGPREALALLESMYLSGISPNPEVILAALDACRQLGGAAGLDTALSLEGYMRRHGVAHTRASWALLVQCAAGAGRLDAALRRLEAPDAETLLPGGFKVVHAAQALVAAARAAGDEALVQRALQVAEAKASGSVAHA
jgi:hypothetical protein